MLHQERDQLVTLTALYRPTLVREGAKHHLHRDPLQGLAQG
jgi:hypothetical protein